LTFADLHLVLVDSSEAHGARSESLSSKKQLFVHINVQPVTLSLSVDQVELISRTISSIAPVATHRPPSASPPSGAGIQDEVGTAAAGGGGDVNPGFRSLRPALPASPTTWPSVGVGPVFWVQAAVPRIEMTFRGRMPVVGGPAQLQKRISVGIDDVSASVDKQGGSMTLQVIRYLLLALSIHSSHHAYVLTHVHLLTPISTLSLTRRITHPFPHSFTRSPARSLARSYI